MEYSIRIYSNPTENIHFQASFPALGDLEFLRCFPINEYISMIKFNSQIHQAIRSIIVLDLQKMFSAEIREFANETIVLISNSQVDDAMELIREYTITAPFPTYLFYFTKYEENSLVLKSNIPCGLELKVVFAEFEKPTYIHGSYNNEFERFIYDAITSDLYGKTMEDVLQQKYKF